MMPARVDLAWLSVQVPSQASFDWAVGVPTVKPRTTRMIVPPIIALRKLMSTSLRRFLLSHRPDATDGGHLKRMAHSVSVSATSEPRLNRKSFARCARRHISSPSLVFSYQPGD